MMEHDVLEAEILRQLHDMQQAQIKRHDQNIEVMTAQATASAALATTVTDLRNELFGEGGRIVRIEKKQVREEWKTWIGMTVAPIIFAVKAIVHKLGAQ